MLKNGLLNELPPPPKATIGWPWTEQSPILEDFMANSFPWPKISIVTPSLNQGRFIEETIRSVLLQNYPNLEYIIMDGGSTDESLEIIKKYEPWLKYSSSKKDNGQSAAINEGLSKATGLLGGWMNSDDLFLPSALKRIAIEHSLNSNAIAFPGNVEIVDIERNFQYLDVPQIADEISTSFGDWGKGGRIAQPGCLFLLSAFWKIGGLKEYLHYVMDVDLWMRLRKIGPFQAIDATISQFRDYPAAKTSQKNLIKEGELLSINIPHQNFELLNRIRYRMARTYFLNLDLKNFILLVVTWLYQKSIKKMIVSTLSSCKNFCQKIQKKIAVKMS